MFQPDGPNVLPISAESNVIDRDMLIALIIEQGPKGEAGRLFLEDGIKLNETKEIRIEFLNISKIDYMWAMPNLVTIKLCNNAIEKIENLHVLVHLRELDLSFNRIKVMENLCDLSNLEVLLLYGNEISKVDGIDNLMKLSILSIGNNNIADLDHVMYLRKFPKLQSLNMEGNPCTRQNEYVYYLLAFIPQLVYYQYQMITEDTRKVAIEKYYREISYMQECEMREKTETVAQPKFLDDRTSLTVSYMECLGNGSFFYDLFEYDQVGRELSMINDETQNIFGEYRNSFSTVCEDLCKEGLKAYHNRIDEIKLFTMAINKAKNVFLETAQGVTHNLIKRKVEIIKEVKQLLSNIQDDIEIGIYHEKVERARDLTLMFNNLISTSWSKLMFAQVSLHDQIKNYFSIMRNAEAEYSDRIKASILYFLSGFEDDTKLPEQLLLLCGSKDILINNLTASHDGHLQTINRCEDNMLTGLRNWLKTYIAEKEKCETERNWHQILEISHFLDTQREDFDSLDLLHQFHLFDIEKYGADLNGSKRN